MSGLRFDTLVKVRLKCSRLTRLERIIYAIIIGFAVVAFWRGSWQLMDIYLLPSNYVLSNWASLFLGIFILVLTHKAIKELM